MPGLRVPLSSLAVLTAGPLLHVPGAAAAAKSVRMHAYSCCLSRCLSGVVYTC